LAKTTTFDLVEEALTLLERGELTLEEGPSRYGLQWPAIRPAIETALRVVEAANPPIVSQRPFTPLDKTSGWQSLKAQLEVTRPAPVAAPARRVAARRPAPSWNWLEVVANFFGTKVGRAAFGTMLGLALVTILFIQVSASLPGDAFYRAKLGWDYLGEVVNIDPNDRAQAALSYSDHRLNELEKLAYVGTPNQVIEAEGQYLRGLDAGLRYADQKNFNAYGSLYDRLNDQRDRVFRLQQSEYIFGPHSQLNILADQLNSGVYTLAPKVPGSSPTPTTGPTPVATPAAASPGATAPPSVTAKATTTPAPTTLLNSIGENTGLTRLIIPTATASPTAKP
jgi:hypothetical protein